MCFTSTTPLKEEEHGTLFKGSNKSRWWDKKVVLTGAPHQQLANINFHPSVFSNITFTPGGLLESLPAVPGCRRGHRFPIPNLELPVSLMCL